MLGSVLLAVLALALATPPPFTVDMSTPAPSAKPLALPEIGRTRSNSRACTAYRELVVPSLSAVMRADARFTQARDHIGAYGDRLSDPGMTGNTKGRMLDLIDRDGLAMLKESMSVSRALGDPRLAHPSDPDLQAERAALQKLYDAQHARAFVLINFSRELQRNDLGRPEGPDPFGRHNPDSSQDAGTQSTPPPAPDARPTPDNAFPQLTGIPLTDKAALRDWSSELGSEIRSAEIGVAPTLVRISRGCR